MTAKEAESALMNAASQAFEIIPSYFEETQQKAIAVQIARVLLEVGPCLGSSPQVRQMLERYAALDITFPYL